MPGSKTISLKIALSGEKEFRAAMQAAKKESGLLNTELKNLESKYKDNANTLEALRARQEKLTEAQETYTKRVKTAQEGLENAKKNEEAQNKRLQELKEKLEEAEKALESMKDQGLENTEAYKKQEEAVQKLTEEVSENRAVYAKTEGAVADWRKELSNAQAALDETNKEIDLNEKYLREAEQSADGCATSIDKYGDEVKEAADDTGKLNISLSDMVKNKIIDLAGDALMELGRKAIEAAKYVVEVGSSFEAQMSKVQAISGASSDEMAKLTEKAEEMGRTTKFTATESGEALEYMAMAGWKTNDMLDGLEGIMNLAAASGEDLGTTSDIVTDALTAFGLEAKDSGHFADVLAAASTNANTNVSMMGETFKYAAPIAGALGYSAEDTAEAIGLMANSGIKASQAGTSLRSIMTQLSKEFVISGENLGEVTIQTTNADGTMRSFSDILDDTRWAFNQLTEEEKVNTAKTLVGKNAMSGFLALMNSGEGDINKLRTALENCDGAASAMADTMQDNLQGKLTLFNSACEGLGIALYNYFSGPLSEAVELATNLISGITEALTPQKTELETFIDDIDKANAQVERSIENAISTKEKGEADAAEIEGYKTILDDILSNCEQFNRIDLGNGRFNIVDAANKIVGEGFESIDKAIENTNGHLEGFAPTGIDTEMIKWKVDEITGDDVKSLGYVKKKADEAEEDLENFAPDGINTDGVSNSVDDIIEYFDENGESIGTFRDNIVVIGEEFDTEGVKKSLDEINNEVFVVTDEFSKFQISTMVDVLSDSVDGLAESWNRETGELSASREELESWFDTAQTVAMQNALQKAMDELYSARADALINVAKAQSSQNQALKEFNELAGTSYETYEEWLDKGSGQLGETIEYSKELANLESTLYDSQDALEESNANLEKSSEELKNTSESISGLKDVYLEGADAVGKSAEQAAADLEGATEETGELADATEDLSETTSRVSEELATEYGKILESIRNTVDGAVTAWSEMEEADDMSVSKMIDNLSKNLDRTQQWETNMEILGRAIGQGFPQTLYDELVTAGPGKMDNAVADLVRMCQDPTSAEFSELARLWDAKALETMSAQENLAPFTTVGTAIGGNVASGIDDSIVIVEESATSMTSQANEAAQTEAQNASTVGEEMATSTSSAIDDSKQEVSTAAEGMISDARDAADQIASDFYTTGQQIPQKLRQGINQAESADYTSPRPAVESMMQNAANAASGKEADFYNSGVNLTTGLANGINAGAYGPINAAQNLAIQTLNAFNNTAVIRSPSRKMKESGEYLVEGLIQGIEARKADAVNEAIVFGEDVMNGINQSIKITSQNQEQYIDQIGKALWGSGVNWSKYGGKFINAADFSRNAMASQSDITKWASASVWKDLDTASGKADMQKWLKSEFGMSGSDITKAINAVAKALQVKSGSSSSGNISMFDSGGRTTSSSSYAQDVSDAKKSLVEEAEKARAAMQIEASRAENLLRLANEKTKLSAGYEKLASKLQSSKLKASDDISSSMLALQSQAVTASRYKLLDQLQAEIDTYKNDTDGELQGKLSSLSRSSSSGVSSGFLAASEVTGKSIETMQSAIEQTSKNTAKIRSITSGMSKTLTTIANAIEAGMTITVPVTIGNEKLDTRTVRIVKQAINAETRALAASKGR